MDGKAAIFELVPVVVDAPVVAIPRFNLPFPTPAALLLPATPFLSFTPTPPPPPLALSFDSIFSSCIAIIFSVGRNCCDLREMLLLRCSEKAFMVWLLFWEEVVVVVLVWMVVTLFGMLVVRLERLLVATSNGEVGLSIMALELFLFLDCPLDAAAAAAALVALVLGECFFLSKISLLPPFHP